MKFKATLLLLPLILVLSFTISSPAFGQNKAKTPTKVHQKSKTPVKNKTTAKSSTNSKPAKKVTKSKPVKYIGKEFKNAVKSVKKEL